MQNITIYIDHLVYEDGIFTWMVNFCKLFHIKYSIEIISKAIRPRIKDILDMEGIKFTEWKADITYSTDVLLLMLDYVRYPSNFTYKKKFKIVHCNYDISKNTFTDLDDGSEFIAVSEQAAIGFTKKFNLPCKDISSFVIPYEPKKVLHIISCSRVYNNKGFERMFRLADDLDEYGVRFQWINYSEIDINGAKYLKSKQHNLITFLPKIDHNHLLDLIADADYLVQLSDREGYCYAVHEALMLGTPVIVTDIEAFKDVVTDGVNGYKLPVKMDYKENALKKIINDIPKGFSYEENMIDIVEKWRNVLE